MTEPDYTAQTTEDLLHGLIAECAGMIRTQLHPGMSAVNDTAEAGNKHIEEGGASRPFRRHDGDARTLLNMHFDHAR